MPFGRQRADGGKPRVDLHINIPEDAQLDDGGAVGRAGTSAPPPRLRTSKSMGDCLSSCSCASGALSAGAGHVSHRIQPEGPLTAGTHGRGAFSFVSDAEARCLQAKLLTDRQLQHLLKLPVMQTPERPVAPGTAGGGGLTDAQRQALLALRELAVTFIDHADHASTGLLCQQLMRSAHELRLPLTGVGIDDINLSTRFVLALTPCARLLPVQQHLLSAEPAEEEEGVGGEAEGGDAEAVLQRFYQRWQQSGAAWSNRIQRRHSMAAPPFVGLSNSLPAASVLEAHFGSAAPAPFALDGSPRQSSMMARSWADLPAGILTPPTTPCVTPKPPRRRGSAPDFLKMRELTDDEPGASPRRLASLGDKMRERSTSGPSLGEAAAAFSTSPPALEELSCGCHGNSSSESSFSRNDGLGRAERRSTASASTPMSPPGVRRSTVAGAPLLLCRICERMIPADQLEVHSKQCLLEVVVFTAEQRLEKLKDMLTREVEARGADDGPPPGGTQGSVGARQVALLHLLMQTCEEALSLEMDEARSTEMLRDARELQVESHRLGDAMLISLAEQLHAVLEELRPFWREERHGSLPGHRRSHSGDRAVSAAAARAADAVSINSFEILKPISRGAYGRVVLAAKRTTRDLYAIKVVRKRDMRRKNQVHRIKVEREVMAEANHPFLVKLYYSFQTAERLYMVMEFVNGGDLYSLLRNVGYLAEEVVRLYAGEIALALEYLHAELGVVHRDLKPDNVLIDEDGHIKLTDFGLSVLGMSEHDTEIVPDATTTGSDDAGGAATGFNRRESDPMAEAHEEELHEKVGTPDYMAPEILLGERHGTPVDLWALGCLTFELLTGYTPFTGESVAAIFEHILEHAHGDAVRWPEEEDHLSPEAVLFVRSLLEPLPERRRGGAGTHEAFRELRGAPFFRDVEWDALQSREGVAPFVPALEGSEDVSYFVSKPQPDSRGSQALSVPTTPLAVPMARRQISVEDFEAMQVEGDDPDFLNFTFNGLSNLMQRNLEIAREQTTEGRRASPGSRQASPGSRQASPGSARSHATSPGGSSAHAAEPHTGEPQRQGSPDMPERQASPAIAIEKGRARSPLGP